MDYTKTAYQVFIGTDSGILKGVQFTSCGANVKNFPTSTTADRGNEITALAWRDNREKEIYIGHRNKTVSLFDTQSQAFIFRHSVKFGSGKVVGIIERNGIAFVGVESGHISSIFKMEKGDKVSIDTLRGMKKNRKDKPTLAVVRSHPAEDTQFATAGCENDLKIWDVVNPGKPVFHARNIPHDELNLRVPVWPSDLAFMQDNHTVAVVSRHKCVRLYDPRAQNRPVLNIAYEESPLTAVSAVPDRQGLVVLGTAHGRVSLFDLRAKVRNRAPVVFKGINGAVKDVAVPMPSPPHAYSVSLDRHVRVHDLETKQTVHKEYLKSRLTKVLVRTT